MHMKFIDTKLQQKHSLTFSKITYDGYVSETWQLEFKKENMQTVTTRWKRYYVNNKRFLECVKDKRSLCSTFIQRQKHNKLTVTLLENFLEDIIEMRNNSRYIIQNWRLFSWEENLIKQVKKWGDNNWKLSNTKIIKI